MNQTPQIAGDLKGSRAAPYDHQPWHSVGCKIQGNLPGLQQVYDRLDGENGIIQNNFMLFGASPFVAGTSLSV